MRLHTRFKKNAFQIKMIGISVASFNSAHVVQTFMREIYGIDLSPNQILTPDVNDFHRDKRISITSIYHRYEENRGRTPRIVFFDDDKNNINNVKDWATMFGQSHPTRAIHVPKSGKTCGLTAECFQKHFAESLTFFRNQGNDGGDVILFFDFDCTLTKCHIHSLQQIGEHCSKQRESVVAEHSEMAQILKKVVRPTFGNKQKNFARRVMRKIIPPRTTRHDPALVLRNGMISCHPPAALVPQNRIVSRHPPGALVPQNRIVPRHPPAALVPQNRMVSRHPPAALVPQNRIVSRHPPAALVPQNRMVSRLPLYQIM